jgi:microcin C transport system substrate-binding protein
LSFGSSPFCQVCQIKVRQITTTRRSLLQAAGRLLLTPALTTLKSREAFPAQEAERSWHHGLSLFGQLKYTAGFAHFDYINPQAPKLGTVRRGAFGTYDNFNVVIAGLKGNLTAGIDFIYESLLTPSLDEISSEYGLIAEAVSFPPDFSSVTFRLRPQARWHDGKPITPADVIFSFNAFKTHSPEHSIYYRHVREALVSGEREVTFAFDGPGIRELPLIVGQLTILPKHWWEGPDSSGQRRNVANTTLEPLLGSGPYRIKAFEAGNWIIYERVDDYWGGDLNVRVGHNNFDRLRFDYFRDLTVLFQAFKADDLDWHVENNAVNWVTGYDFPAVSKKWVVREQFPIRNVGVMQAFAFNARLAKFKDWRLRRAFNFAFDFETINRDIFYGEYTRISSYFQGTELACTGLPQGRELEILEPLRGEVPPEVFTTPYWNPVGGNLQADDNNLREAKKLLEAAGFVVRDLKLVDVKTRQPLRIEFLLAAPTYERFVLIYKEALERLGIDVLVRMVDAVQYENRLRNWEFDIVVAAWAESLTPGNEQREYWGSRAARTPGSRNLIGIADKAIDGLIERVVLAVSRDELVAATHALDRVLLWHHYVVPQWTYSKIRTARWDRFAKPDRMPSYGLSAFPDIWWWDTKRAEKLAAAR